MRICRPWFIVAIAALFIPSAARADDHWMDANAAISYSQGSKLWGGYFAYGITARDDQSRLKRVSVVGDFSFHNGDNNAGIDVRRIAYAIGGRVFANPSPGANRVFAQATVGRVHDRVGSVKSANGALTIGVGYEFHLASNQDEGFATRFQVDYLVVNNVKDRPRASLGIVYRFD